MSSVVKAAARQISPALYSRQGTVEKLVKRIPDLDNPVVLLATFLECRAVALNEKDVVAESDT